MVSSYPSWLKQWMFQENPFEVWTAERENYLEKLFLHNRYIQNVQTSKMPTLYFAGRGNGKSAMAKMVKIMLERENESNSQTLVISFDIGVFEQLAEEVGRDFTKIDSKQYRKKVWELTLQAARQKEIDLDNISNELLPTNMSAALKKAGLSNIYLLVDGPDELIEMNSNIQRTAKLLEPFLSDTFLLQNHSFNFKFFLSLEIYDLLYNNNNIRFDRFYTYINIWKVDDLKELLRERLRVYSVDKNVTALSQFSNVNDIDHRMCEAAQGSPRTLIQIGQFLFQKHEEAGAPPLISEQVVNETLAHFKLKNNLPPDRNNIFDEKPVKIFVCYSIEDLKRVRRAELQELLVQLKPLERAQLISIHHEGAIKAGEVLQEKTSKALEEATIAVILIGPHLLASEAIVNNQLPYLLNKFEGKRGIILPVILRYCDFNNSSLSVFQAVNDPQKPLTAKSRTGRDRIWLKLCERIRELVVQV